MSFTQSGIADRPVQKADDLLGLKDYADSLATFILTCETPITIGIQGDWGAGKTSLMEMVKELVEEQSGKEGLEAFTVWFNTWMYSQFNAGDRLSLLMLHAFIDKLPSGGRGHEKAVSYLATLGKLAAGVAAKQFAGIELDFSKEANAPVGRVLEDLKAKFVDIVQAYCGDGDRNRVVFFVDDLDRLLPEKAVELMEVIKIFLDSPNVVFVLACDYQVVVKGIRAKFKLDESESYEERSFFDKIIQVPFRMPMHRYDLMKYVAVLLERIGWDVRQEQIGDYCQLLEYSVGFNPRTIKRLFNTTLLLTTMLRSKHPEILDKDHSRKLLFAVVCMEMKYPSLYTYLGRDPSRIKHLRDTDSIVELAIEPEVKYETSLQPLPHFTSFATKFYKLVDVSGDGEVSIEEQDDLQKIFGMSKVTSAQEEPATTAPANEDWKREQFFDRLGQNCPKALFSRICALCQQPPKGAKVHYYRQQDSFYCCFSFRPFRSRLDVRPFAIYDDGQLVVYRRKLASEEKKWATEFVHRLADWFACEGLQFSSNQARVTADQLSGKWDAFQRLVENLARMQMPNPCEAEQRANDIAPISDSVVVQ